MVEYKVPISEVPMWLTSLELSSKVSTLSHLKMPTHLMRMRIIVYSSSAKRWSAFDNAHRLVDPAVRHVFTLFWTPRFGHLVE